jgi:hypothetical protein
VARVLGLSFRIHAWFGLAFHACKQEKKRLKTLAKFSTEQGLRQLVRTVLGLVRFIEMFLNS